MNWSASVLSTVSSDTEPTIIVAFDNAKYIFNAGENTSRSFLQSRRHWRRARGIFLTSVGSQRCSGLPGLLMFWADAGISRVEIVGPQGLLHYLASMRAYLKRMNMSVNATEAPSLPVSDETRAPEPVYTDENISLYAIPIHASPGHTSEAEQSVTLGAKRKRSPSPPSSSKRPLTVEQEFSHENLEATDSDVLSLRDRVARPDFSPIALRGDEAQTWRRAMLDNMFPYRAPPRDTSTAGLMKEWKMTKEQERQKKSQKRQKEEIKVTSWDVDPEPSVQPESSISQSPSTDPLQYVSDAAKLHRDRRLPAFSFPNNDRSQKPTLCYVVVGPRVRGKFDVAAAQRLGVRPGALYGRLTRGMSVTIKVDDGNGNEVERTVRPEDCVGPTENPQVMIVLDVPTPDHIPELVKSFSENPFYAQFRSKSEQDKEQYLVHVVFHLCGKGVFEDQRYKEFLQGFAEGTNHLVSSRDHGGDPMTFTSAAYTQLRLNKLDSDMFPTLKFDTTPRQDLSTRFDLPLKTDLLEPHTFVDVRPPRDPRHDTVAQAHGYFHPATSSRTRFTLPPAILDEYADVQGQVRRVAESKAKERCPGDDVEIIPLGTSSASPSKYRNVSSTLVRIPNWGSILLDAGEGTWGQLVRLFGDDLESHASGVWEALRDLKCIFLSHMHGDHHIGTAKILAMRKLMNPPPTQPLYIIGLRQHLLYLREQSELEDLGIDSPDGNGVITILADVLNWRTAHPYAGGFARDYEPYMDEETSKQNCADMCRALGLAEFTAVDVYHRTRCYGAVIKHSDQWSLVYSADTSPTHNLVKAGQGATLLIHEATMGDEEKEMARDKAHSTSGQALDIGLRMKAKNILLTHFSARYPKMPPFHGSSADSPQRRGPTVALAFDHTKCSIGDLWKLNLYADAIQRNYADIAAQEGEELPEVTW